MLFLCASQPGDCEKWGFKLISRASPAVPTGLEASSLIFLFQPGLQRAFCLQNPPPHSQREQRRWDEIRHMGCKWGSNLVFAIANVFKLFETPYVYSFWIQRQGGEAGGERQNGRGERVCAPAQSPTLQPKGEIFVFQWIFCRQKASEGFWLIKGKKPHIFSFYQNFTLPV